MSSEEARLQGASDWQAMNIFVFSNGQQYTPPRKYHLRIEELDWWKSTLNLLARTQYGILHSNIELYTLEGKKIVSPMELSNGAYYVAVKPPDKFVNTGYEKYLIRASRSWEKRQSRIENTAGPDVSKNNTEMGNATEESDDPLREDNLILNTIISSMVNHETRPIEQPGPEVTVQNKPGRATVVKPIDRKITTIPHPTVKKSNPPSPTKTYLKPSFKRNDSLKTANVKITKPEGNKYVTSGSSSKQTNKLPAKSKVYKDTTKSKETAPVPETVVRKVHETASKLKASSSIKIININNGGKLSTNSANLENVVEDKEIVMVPHFLQNAVKDTPLVTVHPIQIQHGPKISHGDTENFNENIEIENQENQNPQKATSEIKIIATKSSKDIIKILESPPVSYSMITDEHFDKRYTALNEDKGMNNQVNYEINKINKTQDSPPRKHSIMIMTEILSDNTCESHNIDENINLSNEIKITNQVSENNKNIKIHNASPQRHSVMIMTDICTGYQGASSCSNTISKDEINNNITNDVKNNVPEVNKNVETHNTKLHQTTSRSLNDQYVAVLNKGDVVNLKLNIEILNHAGLANPNENTVNLPSVNNILHTDKDSQINFDNQLVAQNKSLLSMIAKEINNHYTGDNHRIFLVQSGTCKYCNDQKVEISDNTANKSYMIILPLEKFEEKPKGCPCNVHDPHIQLSSSCQPVKATYSCMSLQRLTKTSQIELPVKTVSPIHISTSDVKTDETVVLGSSVLSEKDVIPVVRKKSVAINEDSMTCTRQSSKICQSISLVDESDCNKIGDRRNCPEIPKTIVDNSTLTEWCDVLLEAKLVEDGHYTLRLPTLEMLKYYKLA